MQPEQAPKSASPIVFAAITGALLLTVQVALRLVPNVELVTVILMVSAYALPPSVSILAALVFCTGEWLIYGFGYWVPAYYIYWCLLAAVSTTLKLVKRPRLLIAAAVLLAAVCTALFGALTSAVEALLIMGFTDKFLEYFLIVYLRGIEFYLIHIISNSVIVAVLFGPAAHAVKGRLVQHMAPPSD